MNMEVTTCQNSGISEEVSVEITDDYTIEPIELEPIEIDFNL